MGWAGAFFGFRGQKPDLLDALELAGLLTRSSEIASGPRRGLPLSGFSDALLDEGEGSDSRSVERRQMPRYPRACNRGPGKRSECSVLVPRLPPQCSSHEVVLLLHVISTCKSQKPTSRQ